MIVLDEQMMGHDIDAAIARWYPGRVLYINDLRPHSVIKDEAIPSLLSREDSPTFVTLNDSDFWKKTAISDRFCVVCIAVRASQLREAPMLLRRLLRYAAFRKKAGRMGHMFRLAVATAEYYSVWSPVPQALPGWQPGSNGRGRKV